MIQRRSAIWIGVLVLLGATITSATRELPRTTSWPGPTGDPRLDDVAVACVATDGRDQHRCDVMRENAALPGLVRHLHHGLQKSATSAGTERDVVVPSPSSPRSFEPQQATEPVSRRAQACAA